MWETLLNGVDLVRALLIMQGYVSGPKVDRLVGWLPGSASQILGGLANKIPGDRAWVEQRKDPNEWRATLAHELGHTYGLKHNSLKTNDYHWFDVYERTIKPPNMDGMLRDFIQKYGAPEEEFWVSPDSYTFLYNRFCSGIPLQPAQPRTASEVLIVSGNVLLSSNASIGVAAGKDLNAEILDPNDEEIPLAEDDASGYLLPDLGGINLAGFED